MEKKETSKLKEVQQFDIEIFKDLKIKNQLLLNQEQLDAILKKFIQNNEEKSDQPDWLKNITFPQNKDGTKSYGQLNRDGSISVGVRKADGSLQSMDDYYKQYPWNKPGLSSAERDQLFESRKALEPLPTNPQESSALGPLPPATTQDSASDEEVSTPKND